MSDLLTHWAVFDDARRLVQVDERIDPLVRRVIEEHREFARLGALTRSGNKMLPAILTRAKQNREQLNENEAERNKLAFGLGLIAHYGADRVMKRLMADRARAQWKAEHPGEEPATKPSIREVSAYYDAHVFRKVYLDGNAEPFTSFLLAANGTPPGKALEAFIRSLFQRAMLSSHTLSPDVDDVDGWLDQMIQYAQPMYVGIAMYAEIYANPDPAKMAMYGVETLFYLENDPAVAAARTAQRGDSPSGQLDSAIAEGANRGGYGQALALAMRRLREASDWWRCERSELPEIRQ